MANFGKKGLDMLLRTLRKVGLKATLPPELMFLDSFYKPQTLSSQRLRTSSFVDPMPEETIFTRLPDLVVYYLTRWSHENLISTFKDSLELEKAIEQTFKENPKALLDTFHSENLHPYADLRRQ